MIVLDRQSRRPVNEQIVEQLRYLIASGTYRVGDPLPSTRDLARRLEVSFHTIRKAYQQLAHEGYLQAQEGASYLVRERIQENKSVRMERGAAVVQETLQRLFGLGLSDSDIEYLVQDQLEVLESARQRSTLLFVAATAEIAALYAEPVASAIQQDIEPVSFQDLGGRADADIVFTRIQEMRKTMAFGLRADVLGVMTYLPPALLDRIGRMTSSETLGLVTKEAASIPVLLAELQSLTGFEGQAVAASVEESARQITDLIERTDLLVYTPGARRRLTSYLMRVAHHDVLAPAVARESLEQIKRAVPS